MRYENLSSLFGDNRIRTIHAGTRRTKSQTSLRHSWRKVYLPKGKSEDLDGVMVFSPQGKPLAHIRLPERCANLTFGGPKNNRLYTAACHSLYALYVEAHGAT
jgi:hypothetical protein